MFDNIKKEIAEYHFLVGVFPANNQRGKVHYHKDTLEVKINQNTKKKSIEIKVGTKKRRSVIEITNLSKKTGKPEYKNMFDPNEIVEFSNADILNLELEKERNYLEDMFNRNKNPSISRVIQMLSQFKGQNKSLNMQQVCQEIVNNFRMFIGSNPYNMRNAPATVKKKSFDQWMIDSRQLQMSVRAKFLHKNIVISESKHV